MRVVVSLVWLVLFIVLIASQVVEAATYYVATAGGGGSDSNPGTVGSPFLTVGKGVRALQSGDTLMIRSGTYSIGTYGNVASDTYGCIPSCPASFAAATTISNFPGEIVTINGAFNIDNGVSTGGAAYVMFVGDSRARFIVQGGGVGFRINNGAHHIRISTMTIRNATSHGVQGGATCSNINTGSTTAPRFVEVLNNEIANNGTVTNQEHGIYPACSEDWTISGNYFHGNQGYGVHVYSGTSNFHLRAIIKGNTIIGRKSTGTGFAACIVIAQGSAHQVFNNLCVGQGTEAVKYNIGIQMYGVPQTGTTIYNNTIYDVTHYGVSIEESGVTSSIIRNNIFNTIGVTAINGTGIGTTIDRNFCPSACGTNSFTTSPGFTTPGTDFSLSSSANAVDVGATLASVTTDILGTARPQGAAYDIGAYERLGSDTTAPAPPTGVEVTQHMGD